MKIPRKRIVECLPKVFPIKRDEPAFLKEKERLKEVGYFVF
jgi:hypothetical protein